MEKLLVRERFRLDLQSNFDYFVSSKYNGQDSVHEMKNIYGQTPYITPFIIVHEEESLITDRIYITIDSE